MGSESNSSCAKVIKKKKEKKVELLSSLAKKIELNHFLIFP